MACHVGADVLRDGSVTQLLLAANGPEERLHLLSVAEAVAEAVGPRALPAAVAALLVKVASAARHRPSDRGVPEPPAGGGHDTAELLRQVAVHVSRKAGSSRPEQFLPVAMGVMQSLGGGEEPRLLQVVAQCVWRIRAWQQPGDPEQLQQQQQQQRALLAAAERAAGSGRSGAPALEALPRAALLADATLRLAAYRADQVHRVAYAVALFDERVVQQQRRGATPAAAVRLTAVLRQLLRSEQQHADTSSSGSSRSISSDATLGEGVAAALAMLQLQPGDAAARVEEAEAAAAVCWVLEAGPEGQALDPESLQLELMQLRKEPVLQVCEQLLEACKPVCA
jgi:hypothetical protein